MSRFCLHRWISLLALATVASCSGGVHQNGSIVVMYDNQFSGALLRVPVGARVSFLNLGRSVHNAMGEDGTWKVVDVPGESGAGGRGGDVVFTRPGVYRYHCGYHGTKDGKGMAGVIVVGDVEYAPRPTGAIAAVATPSGATRRVPQDYPTIQTAVDAAAPGDLVLVDRGVYKEEVRVTTPSLVIRGVDRNDVIIDGEFVRGNGISVLADAVAVENMTSRNNLLNGFFWTSLTGFRGSYLTAYNNGDYGIYAFGATDGLLEDSYASGSPDSGFYIGQCYPCKTVIRNIIAENNALGYSGTNAGGQLYLVSSIWRNNGAGIVPSSLDIELNPPQKNAVFAANLVVNNSNRDAPANELTGLGLGNGILLAGSIGDTVERNVVIDHTSHGIIAAPIQDRNYYPAQGNVVRNNTVLGSGRADLANGGPGAKGNCFAENTHRTAAPFGLEAVHGCGRLRFPWWSDFVGFSVTVYRTTIGVRPTFADWKTQPAPRRQPSMADPLQAPVRIAMHVFDSLHFDLAKAQLPVEADSVLAAYRERRVAAVSEAGMFGQVFSNLSFLIVPLVLLRWLITSRRRNSIVRRGAATRWILRGLALAAAYVAVLVATTFYYGAR
jgi:plastocyanin